MTTPREAANQRQVENRSRVIEKVSTTMQSAKAAISAAGYAALRGEPTAAALVFEALRACDRANAELARLNDHAIENAPARLSPHRMLATKAKR